MSYFSMIPTFTILAMAVTALAAPQPAAVGSSSVESVVAPITVYIPETTVTVTDIQRKTVTTTATVTATPEFCCPTTNRIQNPGFSDQTAWVLERGVTILNADPSGASVENVLLADFTAADQGYMFYQTLKNLCPGQTYNFKANIQMWKGSGSAHAEFYLGGQMFLKTQSLTVGPWVTVTGTVIASRATPDLRIIVVSGAEAGARSFLMDSFDLSLA